MARPRSITDETIFAATQRVMRRRGYARLTTTEVAEECGLSRPALGLRFEGTADLAGQFAAYTLQNFARELEAMPRARSGDALINLAAGIGGTIYGPADISLLILNPSHDDDQDEFAVQARRCRALIHQAISERMPRTAAPHDDAVQAFVAHLTGAMLDLAHEHPTCPVTYLRDQTQRWLTLVRISRNFARSGAA